VPQFERQPAPGVSRSVAAASGVAGLLAAHAAVNSRLLRVPPPARVVRERVSVLVPARDEATRIGPCLQAILASTSLPELEVIVLDDNSADGTGEIARNLAETDPRLRVVSGNEPPRGWLGKPYACAQLADRATGDVLVFVDADVIVAPDGLARTVLAMRDSRLDLVCPYPKQQAVGVAERLVQPLLQWSWLTLLPLRLAETSARPSLAAANGQLLCCDAVGYRRAGGHAAVRDSVLDDIALLRAVKRSGGRGVVVDGTDIATTRMYEGWPALRDGYAKSLWSAGGNPTGSAAQCAVLAAIYLLPPAAALRGSRSGFAGYLAGVAGRGITGRRTGARVWPDAAAHPLSIALLIELTALSWWRRRRGTASWKGRRLP
jgi:hypothetical protein